MQRKFGEFTEDCEECEEDDVENNDEKESLIMTQHSLQLSYLPTHIVSQYTQLSWLRVQMAKIS